MRKSFYLLILAFLFVSSTVNAQKSGDAVMILPFENTSNQAAYNWVGESFAEGLTDLFARLDAKGTGLRVVSNDERKLTQAKLRVPLTTLPTLATAIKLAQNSRATLLVLGKYSVTPQQGDIAATLRVTARVIRVQDGAFVTERLADGRNIMREIDLADAINKIQTLQGQVAHQILYQREGNSLSLSQNEVVEIAKRIPPRAFEAYIKGMLTPESDDLRANFFKNALKFYADDQNGEVYPQAAIELGHFYLRKNDFQIAESYFTKLQPTDPFYAEAAFYAGLMQSNLNNQETALQTFRQLADATKLTTAYNNVGATALQLAVGNKSDTKSELLEDGLKDLQQAANVNDDAVSKFNYGYALFVARRYQDAAVTLRQAVAQEQRDGAAYFLLAKSLEKTGDAPAATEADTKARLYLTTYAKTQTEWQKSQTTATIPFRLYQDFNRTDYANAGRTNESTTVSSEDELQNLLRDARKLYDAGRDEEALAQLRQILVRDSMNADTYLLIGKIHLRRGDLEPAVSNLKTAIFWKNDLIEGHIALAKIFLDRSDYNQATIYAKKALSLDPNNQEAIGLNRQIERKAK